MRLRSWFLTGILLSTLTAGAASAQSGAAPGKAVNELSLEELLSVEVTSVGRKAQRLSDAAAAVYVLSRADIRRSGATTIPGALRLVPGVQVARLDSNKWAVSVRGFNSRFANKVLVLVDGRTVYSSLFSGVFWETVELPLDEIERIEVIRGPGGTMWGANAVNGVINIITTHARESVGTLVSLTGESLGPSPVVTVRHGRHVGETGGFRVFGRAFTRDWSQRSGSPDEWNLARAGFRADGGAGARTFSVQGSAYRMRGQQTYDAMAAMPFVATGTASTVESAGSHLAGSLSRGRPRSVVTARAFLDYSSRRETFIDTHRWQADVDLQHHWTDHPRHGVVWGGGYRRRTDDVVGATYASFRPQRLSVDLLNAFIQDEWQVTGALRLTAGLKFEHADVGGGGWQPSWRALWRLHPDHAFWGAASRAVRTPSRAEQDLHIAVAVEPPTATAPLPSIAFVEGSRRVRPEVLWALEAGYRGRFGDRASVDVSLFAHRYSRLIQTPIAAPYLDRGPTGPFVHLPFVATNDGQRRSRGWELVGEWHPSARVRVTGAYSFLSVDRSAPDDLYGQLLTDRDPRHSLLLRAQFDLPLGLELDPVVRAVGSLADRVTPGYAALDLHVARRLSRTWDVSVAGTDLTGANRLEFQPTAVNTRATATRRTLLISATARF